MFKRSTQIAACLLAGVLIAAVIPIPQKMLKPAPKNHRTIDIPPPCGVVCAALIGWLVSKGMDYASAHYEAVCAENPEAAYCVQGAPEDGVGGGGGDAFGPRCDNCEDDGYPVDMGDDGPESLLILDAVPIQT